MDGRATEREDEIYRIFEIPVHSACRTRRLYFSPRSLTRAISLPLSPTPFLFSIFRSFFRFPIATRNHRLPFSSSVVPRVDVLVPRSRSSIFIR